MLLDTDADAILCVLSYPVSRNICFPLLFKRGKRQKITGNINIVIKTLSALTFFEHALL